MKYSDTYTVVIEESMNHVGEELEQNPTLLRHVQLLNESKQDKETLEFSWKYVEANGSKYLQNQIKQGAY